MPQTDCVVYRLNRSAMDKLETDDPAAAVLLQKAMSIRGFCQALHRFSCAICRSSWPLGLQKSMKTPEILRQAQFLCPLQAVSGLS